MVFMEIINLDDSLGNVSEPKRNSASSSQIICSDSTPKGPRKRKKKLSRSARKLKNLLLKKKKEFENAETTNQSPGLDATVNPETNSSHSRNINSGDKSNCTTSKKKRRRKMSSIVVIDSEDDCVVVNNNQFKENKNVDSDVLCLSDNTVIELSDSEDVGVVAGMVETAKESNSWGSIRPKYGSAIQVPCSSSKNSTSINTCSISSQNNFSVIPEFKKRFMDDEQKNEPKKRKNVIEQKGDAGSRTEETNITRQTSRQSISYLPSESTALVKEGPRPIIIDGSNVAFGHGKERFSAKGIEICVDYFLRRKHLEIRAFVPQFRRRHVATVGFHILEKLEKDGHLVYTPSRQVDGKRITSYDDRFIVEYAFKTGGIIVTRDNYQDLLAENAAWSETIKFRLLQYTFVGDMIMFPQDPLGRGGPTLDKFLMF